MKRVLIFGSNGFVGEHLKNEFKEHDYSAIECDRAHKLFNTNSEYYSCDISDKQSVENVLLHTQPDLIINLAAVSSVAKSWRQPDTTFKVNVIGTINILEASAALGVKPKVLLIGSSEEYLASSYRLSEDSLIASNNPYGISKSTQEQIAHLYANRYGLRIYKTRSFNHIGPGQSADFVVSNWCKQVADINNSGKPGSIYVGNLDVYRDFSDVRDIVRGYRLLVESEHYGEVFNFGSGKSISLRELLSKIVLFGNKDIKVVEETDRIRPTDSKYIQADISKAKKMLGWSPEYSIEDSLRDIYTYYLENSN